MDIELKTLRENRDSRGCLVAVEGLMDIDFAIKRVFYIYGNDSSLPRAGHANTECEEACVCLSGSCRITLNDGKSEKAFVLNDPTRLLGIPKNIWVEIDNFSPGCVLLVLASEPYSTKGQIRDFERYKELVK